MRKFSALFLIIPLLLAGCHKNYQMDDLMFAKVLGIDFDGETYTVTVGLKDSSKESEDSKVVKTECKSVSEGISKLSQKADKRIFFGQIRVIILGEECARNGICAILDFFVRSAEMRFDLPVLVAKGTSAARALESGKAELSEKIESLLKSADTVSVSGSIKISRLVEMNEDLLQAVYLPYLTFDGEPALGGYCIFSKDKLIKFLSADISRGINFLNNTFGSWVFTVNVEDDVFTVIVSDSNTKITLKDGIFKINVKFKTAVLQTDSGRRDISKDAAGEMTQKEAAIADELIRNTVEELKAVPADAGGAFGLAYYRANKKIARENEDLWQENFAGIQYETEINAETDMAKIQQAHVKGN